MKHLLTMAVALASATALNATESTDSVRPANMLRAVEVLGIKNSAGSEQAGRISSNASMSAIS